MNDRPRILELVGLAGAGKSTLAKSMRQQNQEIRSFPAPPRIRFISSMARRSPIWLPLSRRVRQPFRPFNLEDLRSIECLDAWLPYLRLKTSVGTDIALLDPGSVYWLSRLQELSPRMNKDSLYQCWWEEKFEQWTSALSAIIWLDAPEELCFQRVRARTEWHIAKYKSSSEVLARFRDLRKGYEQIISRMVSRQPKKVFFFRTDQISTEQMTDQIFSELGLPRFELGPTK